MGFSAGTEWNSTRTLSGPDVFFPPSKREKRWSRQPISGQTRYLFLTGAVQGLNTSCRASVRTGKDCDRDCKEIAKTSREWPWRVVCPPSSSVPRQSDAIDAKQPRLIDSLSLCIFRIR